MARRVTTELIDDTDTSKIADETVEFALDGKGYSIDLTSKNAAELREQLAYWIEHARRSTRGGMSKTATRAANAANNAKIRQWAADNGIVLGLRGRIPDAIIAQYEAAQ
ncbi:MAG: Lsr2 family protein [Spirochaetes bacterium]|nr:MAG: Lsr2 family protein [Spirochaetota bacterium]